MNDAPIPKPAPCDPVLLAEALRAVLMLIDDGDIVRNTDGDGDIMTFLWQGMKITSALQKAQSALASANDDLSSAAEQKERL